MIKEDTASETSDASASDSDVKNAGSYKRQTKKPSCKKRKRMIEVDTETETGDECCWYTCGECWFR